MAIIFVPSMWRADADGAETIEVTGQTLRQILGALAERCPRLADRLRAGDSLATGIAVSIDGVLAPRGLWAPVGADSEVHFLPAIAGG